MKMDGIPEQKELKLGEIRLCGAGSNGQKARLCFGFSTAVEYGKPSSSRQQVRDGFDEEVDLDPIFPNNAGDSDIEFLATQPL